MIDSEIKENKNCMGCYACSNKCPQNCISMINDSEGFWYPAVDYDKCIKCGSCIKACPIIKKTILKTEPKAYACYNKNEAIRMDSSSGGVFTLIAEKVIDNGGVVFGACFDKSFSVIHDYTETKEGLNIFRGSKYVQSKIGNTYSQAELFLKDNRLVLFTGTPCQIAGLKSFLHKDYDNLICQDIICHGVPSLKVWQKYITYRESLAGSAARRIAFRRKYEGWKRYSVSFIFNNDTEYRQTLDKDLMMGVFLKNLCLRPSCYSCSFKTLHRQSDITLADFWGIQNIAPQMDDDKGTSLVFINSSKGQALYNSITKNIESLSVDINGAVKYNSAAIKSVDLNPKREPFFKDLDVLPFDILVRKYCTDTHIIKIKKLVYRVLSKVKRMIIR